MPKSKCPTKWKRAYDTKAEASAHAKDLRAKGTRGQVAYPCPSGEHYHVGNTFVKRRNDRNRNAAQAAKRRGRRRR